MQYNVWTTGILKTKISRAISAFFAPLCLVASVWWRSSRVIKVYRNRFVEICSNFYQTASCCYSIMYWLDIILVLLNYGLHWQYVLNCPFAGAKTFSPWFAFFAEQKGLLQLPLLTYGVSVYVCCTQHIFDERTSISCLSHVFARAPGVRMQNCSMNRTLAHLHFWQYSTNAVCACNFACLVSWPSVICESDF